jgi:hypothetical protein
MDQQNDRPQSSWSRFVKRQAIAFAIIAGFGLLVTSGSLSGALGGVILWMAVLIYFVPYEIAASRKHPSKWAIGALNLFLGWSFFGWVAALVWSLATNPVIK